MISGLTNPARLKIYDGNLPKIGYAGFVDTLYRLSRGVNFLCQSAVGGFLHGICQLSLCHPRRDGQPGSGLAWVDTSVFYLPTDIYPFQYSLGLV